MYPNYSINSNVVVAACTKRNKSRSPYFVFAKKYEDGSMGVSVVLPNSKPTFWKANSFEAAISKVYAPQAVEAVHVAAYLFGLTRVHPETKTYVKDRDEITTADLYTAMGGDGNEPMYLNDGVWMRPNGSTYDERATLH